MAEVFTGEPLPDLDRLYTTRPTTYLGQVATRCARFNNLASGGANVETMSRVVHTARDLVTSLQIEVQNFAITSGAETAPGGPMQVEASIENLTGGGIVRIPWGGASQGTIADGVAGLSDSVTLPTPLRDGDLFAIRKWTRTPAGVVYNFQHNQSLGDWSAVGTTTTNRVMDATLNSGNAGIFSTGINMPCSGIYAQTKRPAILIIGDSHEDGTVTLTPTWDQGNSNGDRGVCARGLGPHFGYIQQSVGGLSLANYIASHTQSVKQAAYVTDVVIELANNDNAAGVATVISYIKTVASYFPGKRIWLTTTPPAVGAPYSAPVISGIYSTFYYPLNSWKRAVPAGFAGCFDVSGAVENPANPGVLYPNVSTDGTHSTEEGNIIKARAIRPELIHAAHTSGL